MTATSCSRPISGVNCAGRGARIPDPELGNDLGLNTTRSSRIVKDPPQVVPTTLAEMRHKKFSGLEQKKARVNCLFYFRKGIVAGILKLHKSLMWGNRHLHRFLRRSWILRLLSRPADRHSSVHGWTGLARFVTTKALDLPDIKSLSGYKASKTSPTVNTAMPKSWFLANRSRYTSRPNSITIRA